MVTPSGASVGKKTGSSTVLPSGEWIPDYQYQMKDHLGNVRTTFSTMRGTPLIFIATMEPNQDEELYFENLDTRHLDAAYNHTPSGAYASYLHGDTTMVGPAIYLPVSKGDTISIEVWARSLYVNSQTTTLPSLVAAVTGAFGGADGGTESQQQIYDLLEGALGTVGLLGSSDSDEVPNATLNYLFFDENLNFINTLGSGFDFAAITSAAASGWEQLALQKVADRKGYVYIYVANESPGDKVWFDDLKIVQKEHPVVQTDDYYPFGATFNGYVSGLKNRYQYQSKEFQEDLDLGIYDFEWRQYDPWNVTTTTSDPLAEKFYSYSPYSWALNNPMRFVDPDGREVRSLEEAASGAVTFSGFAGVDESGFLSGTTQSDPTAPQAEGTDPEKQKDKPSKGENKDKKPSKIKKFLSGVINPLLDVFTTAGAATANNYYQIMKEGFHEGRTTDSENELGLVPVQLDDEFNIVKGKIHGAGGMPAERSEELISHTTGLAVDVVTIGFSPGIKTGNAFLDLIINYVLKSGGKSAVKTGANKAIDQIEK